MKKIIVTEKYNNKKLISFLLDNFSGLNLNLIYKTLRKKDIRINNIKISDNCTISTGDEISIYLSDDILFASSEFKVFFEDENILIINKSSKISVTENKNSEPSLCDLVAKKYCSSSFIPKPCHRLDRNTTGLVCFAKNQSSLDILLEAFKERKIEKHYICIVSGTFKNKSDTLIDYLFKDEKKSFVYISDIPKKNYVQIKTQYTVLQETKNASLLNVNLLTGKTHQIRAHLAFTGHPIIGDRQIWN